MHAFIKNVGLNKFDFAYASESGFFIYQFIITCIGRRDFLFSITEDIKIYQCLWVLFQQSSKTSPLRRLDFRHQQVQLIFNDFLFLGD